MIAAPARPATVLLSVLVVTAGVLTAAPSVAASASAPTVSPSMVLNTAGSPNWYQKSITAAHSSAPAIGKLGKYKGLEIVDGFPDGTVQGWSTTGKHLWTFRTGAGAVQASPLLVDLNRDGHLDVVTANTAGDVWAFTPSLGNKVIFHKKTGDGVHSPGDFATPAVADINRDGKLDVIETSWDHHLHVWSGAGSHRELPGFPVFLKDTSWSSPSVTDVDGDGWPEIVFGFDCAGVPGQPCTPHPGGYVGVMRHNGVWERGWPRFIPQVVWSSPAVVDLLGTGKREVVVGTGSMPSSSAKELSVFTATGAAVPGFPVKLASEVSSSPAIGDVDNDGKKDIVFTTNDGELHVVNRTGKVTASVCVAGGWHSCPVGYRPNVSLADVNDDGKIDIIVGNETSVAVYDKVGSSLRKIRVLGTYGHNPGGFAATPTVAQVAGQTWVIAGTTKPGTLNVGEVFVWKFDNKLGRAPWPTFKRSALRPGHG